MQEPINWKRETKEGSFGHKYIGLGVFRWRDRDCHLLIEDTRSYEMDGHDRWMARIWWGLTENGGWDSEQQHVYNFKTLKESKQFLQHLLENQLDDCMRMLLSRASRLPDPTFDLQVREFSRDILEDHSVESFTNKSADNDSGKTAKNSSGCVPVLILVITSSVLVLITQGCC